MFELLSTWLRNWLTDWLCGAEYLWGTNSFWAIRAVPRILWETNVHRRVYKSSPRLHVLNQINLDHTFPYCFFKIRFNMHSFYFWGFQIVSCYQSLYGFFSRLLIAFVSDTEIKPTYILSDTTCIFHKYKQLHVSANQIAILGLSDWPKHAAVCINNICCAWHILSLFLSIHLYSQAFHVPCPSYRPLFDRLNKI